MDGLNVNWKLFRDIQIDVEATASSKMLQTGSCGLHILHNAFRGGCEAAGWGIEDFLCSLFNLLHDAPARRQDFKETTGCTSPSTILQAQVA